MHGEKLIKKSIFRTYWPIVALTNQQLFIFGKRSLFRISLILWQ